MRSLLGRRMGLTAAVLLAILVLVVVLFVTSIGALREAADRARHAREAIAAARTLEGLALDAQRATRGYVITGDDRFLAPLRRARTRVERESRDLDIEGEDSRSDAPGVRGGEPRALGRGVAGYIAYQERVMGIARRDRRRAAEVVAGGRGERLLNALEARFDRYVAGEARLAERRQEDAERQVARAVAVGVGGIVAAGLLVLGFTAYLLRSVIRPVGRLRRAAGRLEQGELSARVPERGRDEVAGLGRAFNAMAESLERQREELEGQAEELEGQQVELETANAELEAQQGELEEALAEVERQAEFSQGVLDTAHEAFVSMDAEGAIIAWNPSAERLFGWSRDEALGRPLHRVLIPERHREAHLLGLRRLLETGEGPLIGRRVEMEAVCADGRELPVALTISMSRTGEGPVFNAFLHDLTDLRRADAYFNAQYAVTRALAESATLEEARTRTLEALATGLGWKLAVLWRVEPDERLRPIEFWRAPALGPTEYERITRGMTLARGEGRPGHVWQSGAPHWVERLGAETLPKRRQAAARDGLAGAMCLPVTSDGRVLGVIELITDEPRQPDGELVDLLVHLGAQIGQFVERKRAEAEADRLKDEFFALVSHELRTPLTSIVGYTELLLEQEDGDEDALSLPQRQFAGVIERNARRLLRLVGDLLFVAQVEAGTLSLDRREVELAPLAADAVEAARPAAEAEGVALALEVEPVRACAGDPDRLAQGIDNLISNALKFTPAGGRVTVGLREDGDDAVITVTDTGMGVGAEEQQRLFERFFRSEAATARAIQGAGLGLTIVKAIVEAHGGTISLRSEEGAGTSFELRIPVDPDAREGATGAPDTEEVKL